MFLVDNDGVRRLLVVTALPLTDPDGKLLGAAAIFWEGEPS